MAVPKVGEAVWPFTLTKILGQGEIRLGDIDGLNRAAAALDTLSQQTDQHRRAIAGVTAAVANGPDWGGRASWSFETSTRDIDPGLAGTALAATSTATVLRRLAADLAVAEELDQGARQTALAADAAAPTVSPACHPSIGPLGPDELHRHAEAGFQAHLVKPVDPKVLTELLSHVPGRDRRS